MATKTINELIVTLTNRGCVRFFVDTCFLLNEGSFKSLRNEIIPLLAQRHSNIVVARAVRAELEAHIKNHNKGAPATQSKDALDYINEHEKRGHIRTIGDKHESFADQTFQEVFIKYRQEYDLVLLTNDTALGRDLLRLNEAESVDSTHKIWIGWGFKGDVFAACHILDHKTASPPYSRESRTTKSQQSRSEKKLFSYAAKPRTVNETPIGGNRTFSTGDSLKTSGGREIRLKSKLSEGGEGSIFLIDETSCAKIYAPKKRTAFREEKLRLMCDRPVKISEVYWPLDRVFTQDDEFVGFLMPIANGKPLNEKIFGKACIHENFPNWNRRDLVRLSIKIASIATSLNKKGVIIGDINYTNFLISSDSSVQLVDADSMQLEDFPCLVGMNNFRAPEITADNYKDFLRTQQHENFAIATLLFMVLMGGKPPFSSQGGGDPRENIQAGKFPYTQSKRDIPSGPYGYIWSYFPKDIAFAFGRAFDGSPENRPSSSAWLQRLKNYEKHLLKTDDQESLKIFPVSFKVSGRRTVLLKCSRCKTEWYASEKQAKYKKQHSDIVCDPCIEVEKLVENAWIQKNEELLAKEAHRARTCHTCGTLFHINFERVAWFLRKGLELPKRCNVCPRKNPSSSQNRRPTRPISWAPITQCRPTQPKQPPQKSPLQKRTFKKRPPQNSPPQKSPPHKSLLQKEKTKTPFPNSEKAPQQSSKTRATTNSTVKRASNTSARSLIDLFILEPLKSIFHFRT